MLKKLAAIMSLLVASLMLFACVESKQEEKWSVVSFEVEERLDADYGEMFTIPVVSLVGSDDAIYSPEVTVKNGEEIIEVDGMKFTVDKLTDYIITYAVTGQDEQVYSKTTVVKVYPSYGVEIEGINVAACEGSDDMLEADRTVVTGYEGELTDFACEVIAIKDSENNAVENIDWTVAGIYRVTYNVSAKELRDKQAERTVRIYADDINVVNFESGEMPEGFSVVSAGHEDVPTNAVLSIENGGHLSDYVLRYTSGNAGYSSVLKITDAHFLANLRTFDYLRISMYANLDISDLAIKVLNGSMRTIARLEKANEWQTVVLKTEDIFQELYDVCGTEPSEVEALYLYFAGVDSSSTEYYVLIDDMEFGFEAIEIDLGSVKNVAYFGAENVEIKAYDGETEMPDAIDSQLNFVVSVPGTYRITYALKDAHDRDITFERTITVRKPYYTKTIAELGVMKGSAVDLSITDEEYEGFQAVVKSIVDAEGVTIETLDTSVVGEYSVTYTITANDLSATEITRSIVVYEKAFGTMSFDDGIIPEGFVIVKDSNYDEESTKAKLSIEKDTEFGYNLKYSSGNENKSSALRIRNKEFLDYVAIYDKLMIRFVTNNPYEGQINLNWWDYIKPALYSYSATEPGTLLEAEIDCARLRSVYGAKPAEVRFYFSAVDASSTSFWISFKDFTFTKAEENANICRGDSAAESRLAEFDYTITVMKGDVVVENAIDENKNFAMAEDGEYTVIYAVGGEGYSQATNIIVKKIDYISLNAAAFTLSFNEMPANVYCARDNNVPLEGALVIEDDETYGKVLARYSGGGTLNLNTPELLAAIDQGSYIRFRFKASLTADLYFYDPSIGFTSEAIKLTAGEWHTVILTTEKLKTICGLTEEGKMAFIKLYFTGTDSSNPANNFKVAPIEVF